MSEPEAIVATQICAPLFTSGKAPESRCKFRLRKRE